MVVADRLVMALGRALEGQRVGFFCEVRGESRAAFLAARDFGVSAARVRPVNGSEYIETVSGGAVHFLGLRSSRCRGMTFDRVFVPLQISDMDLAEILPALCGSREGAVVYY